MNEKSEGQKLKKKESTAFLKDINAHLEIMVSKKPRSLHCEITSTVNFLKTDSHGCKHIHLAGYQQHRQPQRAISSLGLFVTSSPSPASHYPGSASYITRIMQGFQALKHIPVVA
ncbi:hypothetical protein ElyMa_003527900 [Elysia marginata]|uniref:Uncharacterized protein n=1 Tax=Elysia marginata TaxID=1093978 RepID=A0AAV4EHQ7_9GAST|nr:hypothetical protein ElyMa_003527900 [Elysia marginata]